MNVATFEGVVKQGKIHLKSRIHLPDKIKVYVVVPDFRIEQSVHIFTPRLTHPEQAADFKMEIIEETNNVCL